MTINRLSVNCSWLYPLFRTWVRKRPIPYDITYVWNLIFTDELIYEAETDSPPWRTVLWLSSVRGEEWIGNLGLADQTIKKQIAALSYLFGSLMTITKMLRKFHVFLRMVMQSACSKYWWLFTSRKQLFIFSVTIYISSLNYFLLIPMTDVKMMFRG